MLSLVAPHWRIILHCLFSVSILIMLSMILVLTIALISFIIPFLIFCPRMIIRCALLEQSLPRHGNVQREAPALIALLKHGRSLLPCDELGQEQDGMGEVVREANFLNAPFGYDAEDVVQYLEGFLGLAVAVHRSHGGGVEHHAQLFPEVVQVFLHVAIGIIRNIFLHPHHVRIVPPEQHLLQRTVVIVPLGRLAVHPPLQHAPRVFLQQNAHHGIGQRRVVQRPKDLGTVDRLGRGEVRREEAHHFPILLALAGDGEGVLESDIVVVAVVVVGRLLLRVLHGGDVLGGGRRGEVEEQIFVGRWK
mmetsp:Transcript_3805/g.6722  ORF Transcript_3805/g.6722 Transcript_3805/m.6722 type:complete len:305 (+) Transcript_3805:1039-1953(+)